MQSVDDLSAAISEHTPTTVGSSSSLGQQDGIQVILEANLGGRRLQGNESTQQLLIPPGLKLRLLNGALHLPHSVIILVEPGAELELEGVDIRGRGVHERGLITIEGAGASATLRQCAITGVPGLATKGSKEQVLGVLIAKGGQAVLQHCTITAATWCGINVQDEGSTAQVSSTMVQQCNGGGFTVHSSGKLKVERSIAHNNKGMGFAATMKGVLEAGPGCRSERNEGPGFMASWGGRLVAGEGCYAGGNKEHGFVSSLGGSRLVAGPGCIAEHNGGAGFVAEYEAQLQAGPRCTAQNNQGEGFSAVHGGSLHAS
jgi:hypothetical protein